MPKKCENRVPGTLGNIVFTFEALHKSLCSAVSKSIQHDTEMLTKMKLKSIHYGLGSILENIRKRVP